MSREWLRRTSPKGPILCQVKRKTLTRSINTGPYNRSLVTRFILIADCRAIPVAKLIDKSWSRISNVGKNCPYAYVIQYSTCTAPANALSWYVMKDVISHTPEWIRDDALPNPNQQCQCTELKT